jgi:hypothetical protein
MYVWRMVFTGRHWDFGCWMNCSLTLPSLSLSTFRQSLWLVSRGAISFLSRVIVVVVTCNCRKLLRTKQKNPLMKMHRIDTRSTHPPRHLHVDPTADSPQFNSPTSTSTEPPASGLRPSKPSWGATMPPSLGPARLDLAAVGILLGANVVKSWGLASGKDQRDWRRPEVSLRHPVSSRAPSLSYRTTVQRAVVNAAKPIIYSPRPNRTT